MTNGFEPGGGRNKLRMRLALVLGCCLIAAVGLTLAGPLQFSLPEVMTGIEIPPPPPQELLPEQPQLGEYEENDQVSRTLKNALLILFAVLMAFLAVVAGRRAMHWLGEQMRQRETERRLRSQRGAVAPGHQELIPAMERAFATGRGYLRGGGTSNDAIIAAWLALEAGAKEAGVPRDLAQTPTEFTVDVMHKVAANPAAVRELLALYQIARFTTDHLDDAARGCALDIMDVLAADFQAATVAEPAVAAQESGNSQ